MSLGVKGSEVISPPHTEHCQLPEILGFSPAGAGAIVSSPANASSAGMGPDAS